MWYPESAPRTEKYQGKTKESWVKYRHRSVLILVHWV